MKRLILGAGLAASSLMMTGEAFAQTSDQCGPVYDETLRGDASGELRDLIGQFAVNGVEVHVQILDDGRDDGINNPHDAESFAKRLAAKCNWQDPDRLNVLISLNPRAYDIYETGKADSDISQSVVDEAEGGLVNDLRNSNTSFQTDVARLLRRINPYDTPPPDKQPERGFTDAPPDPEPFPEDADTMPAKKTDIPLKEILAGAGGLMGLTAAAVRTKRGIDISRTAKSSLSTSQKTEGDITGGIMGAETQLSVLPADDAKELRENLESTRDELVRLNEARNETSQAYTRQRRRIWPDKAAVLTSAETLNASNASAAGKNAELIAETQQVADFITRIDELVAGFSKLLEKGHEAAKTITEEGWEIGSLEKKLAEFVKSQQQIAELRSKNYVEKPAELIDGMDDELKQLIQDIKALPSRREEADAAHAEQPGAILKQRGVADKAVKLLNELRDDYQASCIAGIDSADSELGEYLKALEDLEEKSRELSGVRNLKALEDTEQNNANFNIHVDEVNAVSAGVHERAERLETIKQQLPAQLEQISGDLDEVKAYAFQKHHDDIEADTREEIEETISQFKTIQKKAGVKQPTYLELAEEAEACESAVTAVTERAHAEKAEMDHLRAEVVQLESRAESELNQLERYIASNGSDIDSSTENRAQSINLLGAVTTARRQALRSQVDNFNQLISTIESALHMAQADVREAEEERRQREEEQRRQATIAATHSSSSFDSGSSSSSSGGSHNSGSW